VRGREEPGHQPTLGDAEDVRLLGPDVVEHGADVVHLVLEHGELGRPVREAHARWSSRISRVKNARRFRNRAYDGSSHWCSTCVKIPGM
jgi:hypothetical protein